MAVASRGAALSALKMLLNHDKVPAETVMQRPYLPDGYEPSPDPVRMEPTTKIGGYGNAASYVLAADQSEAVRLAIAGPPARVLDDRPSILTDPVAEQYLKASIDLTMEGGTTSGVVYPLAVCELATSFRFRNVGGASAGAIAAALTAAAELGRSSEVIGSAVLGSEVLGSAASCATAGTRPRPPPRPPARPWRQAAGHRPSAKASSD